MTQTMEFEDPDHELAANSGGILKEQAEVFTCLPDEGDKHGYWCFVLQFGNWENTGPRISFNAY